MADISDRLAALCEFDFYDDQRNIESATLAVKLNTREESNFVDRNAFDSKFLSDMYVVRKMRDILDRGDYFVNIIYTYRSCSKAIPQAKKEDSSETKEDLQAKTAQVLQPQIQKVKDLYAFHTEVITFICEQVNVLVSAEKRADTPSEGLLWHLVKILDLLALLDALLNMKACLVTDFAFYKRCKGALKTDGPPEDTDLLAKQGLFLAQQNRITDTLKTEIQQIKTFDEILLLVVNMCATYIETERYVLPSDKHSLLRVIPYALFLMDGREGNFVNIFKNKKINVKRFALIFKRFPVVTLYGDMQIKLENLLKSAPNYVAGAWPLADTEKMAREYEIIHHLPAIRQQHTEYMGNFNTIVNMVKLDPDEQDQKFATTVTDTVLAGLHLISNWTSRVLQQSAWKYWKPNNTPSAPGAKENEDASVKNEYEHVVKENYSKEECFALAEMAGLIKGLANTMIEVDGLLAPFIRSCIHNEVQVIIQLHIGEVLAHATKKKRPIRTDLTQIQTLAIDFVDGSGIDESTFKSKRKAEEVTIHSRRVAPSVTQLDLLRMSIYNLYAVRMNGKKPFEKDISKEIAKLLEDFYARSFNYPYLLDFKNQILEMTDLGDLWYREFYLELTKTLQFPIKLSLPWILTETILDSEDLSMMEYILYPLDIYNDAANRALSRLNQRFLYDEIEAEVNLCFDQLIFKLSNSIYSAYKTHASSLLLDNAYRNSLEQVMASKLRFPVTRYDVIMSQRHYQLLGRYVDLNDLIAQRINNLLRRNIENALSRFESKSLSAVVELDTQLNVIQLTHHLLSRYFLQLDDYVSLYNEVNGSSSLISYSSRVASHVISECASDFLSNHNYNTTTNRFTRSVVEFGGAVARENAPSSQLHWLYGDKKLTVAYGAYHANYSTFFGIEHMRALVRILGEGNVSLVVSELLKEVDVKIQNVVGPYVTELMGAMPPNSKCPLYDYKVSGGIGYFSGKLMDIIHYPPLQSDVFYQLKNFGNAIPFLQMVDLALDDISAARFVLLSSHLGISPSNMDDPPSPEIAPLYSRAKSTAEYVKSENLASSDSVVDTLLNNFWELDYHLRKPTNASLFTSALDQVYGSVCAVRNDWDQQTPEEGAVIPVECATEFYRLFSALKYIFCLPLERGQGDNDNFALFGDGVMWAGLAIIHFLGQRKRFECFDFANHLLRVSELYPPEASEKQAAMFISNATRLSDLSCLIFATLDNYFPEYQPFIIQIHPPQDDSDPSRFNISSTALDQTANLRASQQQHATASAASSATPSRSMESSTDFPAPPLDAAPITATDSDSSFPPPPATVKVPAVDSSFPPPPAAVKVPAVDSSFPPPPAAVKAPASAFPPPPVAMKAPASDFPPPPAAVKVPAVDSSFPPPPATVKAPVSKFPPPPGSKQPPPPVGKPKGAGSFPAPPTDLGSLPPPPSSAPPPPPAQ